jgi:hypothetical protein
MAARIAGRARRKYRRRRRSNIVHLGEKELGAEIRGKKGDDAPTVFKVTVDRHNVSTAGEHGARPGLNLLAQKDKRLA